MDTSSMQITSETQSSTDILSKDLLTGQIISRFPRTPLSKISDILQTSRSAQMAWQKKSVSDRASYLRLVQNALYKDRHRWVELIASETGKPKIEALAHEVMPAIDYFNFALQQMPKFLKSRKIRLRYYKHRKSILHFEPLGCAAIISPWNFPLAIPIGQIIQALLAGNSVILKPSEYTTSVGKKLVDLFNLPSIPSGLIQLVVGDGKEGAALVTSPPDKIFFTGSTAAGRAIMQSAAAHLTPLCLELGGKDAMVVFSDANLPLAAKAGAWGICTNAGQACASVERIYVQESVAETFKTLLIQELRALRQGSEGNNDEHTSDVGPITMPRQIEVYKRQLRDAKERGLIFHTGGALSQDEKYLQPTLLEWDSHSATGASALAVTEETFGPLAVIKSFRTKQEAIELVNDSPYGLLASVFSQNQAEAESFARLLRVGTVTINEVLYTHSIPETPWVGRKASGFGVSHSTESFKEFTQIKHIHGPRFSFLENRLFSIPSLWWYPYSKSKFDFFAALTPLLVPSERWQLRHWISTIQTGMRFLFSRNK